MFGKLGNIISIISEKGAIKKLVIENANPLMNQLIALLHQKFGVTPEAGQMPAVTFLPDTDGEIGMVVLLVYIDQNGNISVQGHCPLNELAEMLPDDIMSLMK